MGALSVQIGAYLLKDLRRIHATTRVWAEFLDVYYRPHLVVVSLNAPTHSASGKKAVNLLQRLVEDLRSTADFALHPEEQEVKVAFESDLDAEAARGAS
jgi:hypothetical protein